MKNILNYCLTLFAFLMLNFGGLALGSLWTDPGTSSVWYDTVLKAPWTPPGFVFGLAWTTIMVCFSIFMTSLYFKKIGKFNPIILISWILNILWSPLFFHLHWLWIAVLVIAALTVVIGKMIQDVRTQVGQEWLLLLPYFVWLNIATSLNLYIAIMN